MNLKTSLRDVEAGDVVLMDRGGFRTEPPSVRKVQRTTSTMIIVDGFRFNKTTGRKIGATGYHIPLIRLPESLEHLQEIRNAIKKKNICFRLSDTKWMDLPLDTLTQIHSILHEATPAQ